MLILLFLLQCEPVDWDAGEHPGGARLTIDVTVRGDGAVQRAIPTCRCLSVEMLDDRRARVTLETLALRGPVEGAVIFAFDERGDRTVTFPVRFDVFTTKPPERGAAPELLLYYRGWSWDAQRAVDWVAIQGRTHEMRNTERPANAGRLRALGCDADLVLVEGGRAIVGVDAVRARIDGLAGSVDPPSWDLGEVVAGRTFTRDVRVSGGKIRASIPTCPCFRTETRDGGVVRVHVDTAGLVGAQDKAIDFVFEGEGRARLVVRFDAAGPGGEPVVELLYSGRRPEWPVLTQDVAAYARSRRVPFAVRMLERPGGARRAAELGIPRTDAWLRDGDRVFVGAQAVHRAMAERRPAAPVPPEPARDPGAVEVRFFYFASCPSCAPLIAKLRARPGLRVELLELDRVENIRELLRICDGTDMRLPVAVIGRRYVAGIDAIERQLAAGIGAELAGVRPATVATPPALPVSAVLVAGLIDGVNPCAFVTAVFLVGFLAFVKRAPGEILAAGAAYVAAVYATYYLVGLGALAALRAIPAGPWLYGATAALVAVLAAVSVRDAIVYARTRDAARVWLQLPLGLKKRIHGAVRAGFGATGFIGGAIAAGFVVTLFETVCTGQIYLPTLVLMAREEGRHGLLALYNGAFVAPLAAVLALSIAGVRSERLARFSERHVVAAKLLMAGLYAGLGVYLLVAIL